MSTDSPSPTPDPQASRSVAGAVGGLLAGCLMLWLVLDAWITDGRMPDLPRGGGVDPNAGVVDELRRGFETRAWAAAGLAVVAMALGLMAMRGAIGRRRIAGGIGVTAGLWTVVAAIVLMAGPERVVTDAAGVPIIATIVLGLLVAVVAGTVARRSDGGSGAPALRPVERDVSRRLILIALGALVPAVISCVVFLAVRDCDAAGGGGSGWLVVVPLVLGVASAVLGVAVIVARRWAVGLLITAAGAVVAGAPVLGAVSCLG